jgi:hypothetical protein
MSKPASVNDDKKVISVRIKRKTEPTPIPIVPPMPKSESPLLYSPQEVRNFVSEFVTSWIRGDIIIHFPTAAELAKQTPLSIAFPKDPSVSAEVKIKEHYIDLLSVCAGIKQVPLEEQEKAIPEVFRMLLMFRSANRIEGKLFTNDLQKRLDKLEETIKAQSKLIDQITAHLFKPQKTPKTKTTKRKA